MSNNETNPKRKSLNKRYFQDVVEEGDVKKIKQKPKRQHKFKGEIITVEQKVPKSLKPHLKRKKIDDHKYKDKRPNIPTHILEKYKRGENVEESGIKTKHFKAKQQRKEIYLEYASEQAARTELLLTEQQGFIEADEGEVTAEYRQEEIADNVDIQSAAKLFKLNLDFGPYSMRYSKNGRHLLLGGRKGHVATFDWITKKMHCEMNVMEEVADVSFLHVHTMFACAQKDHVYIYDNQGTELHCLKRLYQVNRMEFLPYHFLLATGNKDGYLSWLDVSIGELVANYGTKQGDIRIMRQNPGNGVLCVGGGRGVVSMWSPKVREPLAKMLCHATPLSALTVDHKGQHLVTAGLDRKVKIWDIRSLSGPLAEYQLRLPVNQVDVSQKGVLAVCQGNYCELYHNLVISENFSRPYLRKHCGSFVHGMRFCPYEDILGVSTANGFQSLLVPGSGEPNYDALEDNPMQTKSQRREHEVHSLLEKIPPELITLDPSEIATVDEPTLQEKIDAKRAIFFVKPPEIQLNSRRKMKGKGGSAKMARNKQIVKDQKRKEFVAEVREAKRKIISTHTMGESDNFIALETKSSALDRFKPKQVKRKT
ncbi:WD repeat-containing protein 46 [Stomoxys calcitrans]|uniref:WD repeat-containing protein 46 n=1 Tax=Stomoxys calcitrans TaxID=35570 RepID=UPI0027E3A6FD|nr:WD repeat-containing protein 46 [Stomoxys calcitrans]